MGRKVGLAAGPLRAFCKHTNATPHALTCSEGKGGLVFISNRESLREKEVATVLSNREEGCPRKRTTQGCHLERVSHCLLRAWGEGCHRKRG